MPSCQNQARSFIERAHNLVERISNGAEIREEIGSYNLCLRRHTWPNTVWRGLYKHRYEAIVSDGKTILTRYRTKSSDRFLAFYILCLAPFIEQLKTSPEQASQTITALKASIRNDHEIQGKDHSYCLGIS
ncbi:MAG: hypothetical protein KKB21_01695 [Nanoarchaeota archaeon]|nr:hypothetical protein [Nanoarchaeota archaeon]MBU4086270.1 hypothetical protein [Nanoarchaeota archaeon]